MKTSTRAAFAAAVLMAVTFAAVPSSAQEVDFVVRAGAVNPNDPSLPYEYTHFYPHELQVHRGQTVRWEIVGNGESTGFHTVTFQPAGQERPDFLRQDEIPGYYNAAEDWFLPSACGHAGEDPCALADTNTLISSGIPPLTPAPEFSVTIDLPPGDYDYICTVHASMQGTIEVVPEAQALKTQEEIDAMVAERVAADTAAADAVVEENADPGFIFEGDKKIHLVKLGDATQDGHVSILQFFPSSLEVGAGEGVRWIYDDHVVDEVHTASFPEELSGGFAPFPHGKVGFGIHTRCDFDDRLSGAPGIPGIWGVTPVPCPANLELGIATWMTSQDRASGDNVTSPATIHDSGMLFPQNAPAQLRSIPGTEDAFPASFDANFPQTGTFVYECNIHSDPMTGSITVV